jgi:hypothetical protein
MDTQEEEEEEAEEDWTRCRALRNSMLNFTSVGINIMMNIWRFYCDCLSTVYKL